MQEEIVIPIAGMIMVIIIVLGVPIIRVLTRRLEGRAAAAAALPQDVSVRLERIEQAMDSMSLEIERMAEGQRFTTRLLAERMGGEATVPRADALRDTEASGGR